MPLSRENTLPPNILSALCPDSVAVFPTETLYGIGCSIHCENAVARVFEIKGRALSQPPPVLISNSDQLRALVEKIPQAAAPLMTHFWPGSLTIIFPAHHEIHPLLCGWNETQNTRTIAVRQTSHPLAAALCDALQAPVIATSANFSGAVGRAAQPRTLMDIPEALQNLADVVINGDTVGGAPSTIVDCTCEPPRVLRMGAVTLKELQKVLPEIQIMKSGQER
jgi:L-threonylcarbamoyladenylate synthase